jgi:transposase
MYDFMDRSAVKALRKRGYSYSRIARELKCDRRTVKRILDEAVSRKYSRVLTWSPVDVFKGKIMEWLDLDIPVKRMLEMAEDDRDCPFKGSRTAFYRRVKMFKEERKQKNLDVRVRFEGLPGEYLQVDRGEIRNFPFLVQERATRYFFCARLKYSRFSQVEFTDNMKRETLLRCLIRSFEAIGGVPWVCVFDNMKTISPGRDGKGRPIWDETFAMFAAEMEFHPEACHPYSANQKGTVEKLVSWVKSSFLPGRTLEFYEAFVIGGEGR